MREHSVCLLTGRHGPARVCTGSEKKTSRSVRGGYSGHTRSAARAPATRNAMTTSRARLLRAPT